MTAVPAASVGPKFVPSSARISLQPSYTSTTPYLPVLEKDSIHECFIGKLLCAPRDLGRGFNERSYPAMLAQICSAFHGGRPILRIGWRLPVLRKSKRPSKQSQLEDRRTCNTPTIWQLSDLSILYSRRVVIEVSSCYNRSMSECGCTTTAL